jgi:hypothetical protein
LRNLLDLSSLPLRIMAPDFILVWVSLSFISLGRFRCLLNTYEINNKTFVCLKWRSGRKWDTKFM